MATEKTIEQELAERGYGHRRNANSHNTNKHEIFDLETGEVVGVLSAIEAIEMLEAERDV